MRLTNVTSWPAGDARRLHWLTTVQIGYNTPRQTAPKRSRRLTDTFDTQTLVKLVVPHLKINPNAVQFSQISTGKHNASYWVETDLGRFVLRIAPPDEIGFLFYERLMMRQEPQLHPLISAKTTIPVAKIIGYDFSRSQINRDYLLMTALPGTPLSNAPALTPAQTERALYQVGEYLRQLHALHGTEYLHPPSRPFGYVGPHQPMAPQQEWMAAFETMWRKLIDDVVACGGYTPTEAETMRTLFDRHRIHFDRPVTPSLLHMDVWSQNILVDSEGNVTGLVDFDRALWGDAEIEFAVLDYCGISEPPFWEGYGLTRDRSQAAMIRRQFYLLYEVQKYIPIRIWRRNDPAGAARYKQQSFQLAAQLLPHA